MPDESTSLRSSGLIMAAIGAWFIFGVGLIEPLTPSEDMPGASEILVFVGGPIALLALVSRKARTGLMRIAAVVQGSVIVAITIWLLGIQARLW